MHELTKLIEMVFTTKQLNKNFVKIMVSNNFISEMG